MNKEGRIVVYSEPFSCNSQIFIIDNNSESKRILVLNKDLPHEVANIAKEFGINTVIVNGMLKKMIIRQIETIDSNLIVKEGE